MYRKTYAKIDLDNIKYNISKLVNKLSDYKYHIGVVKADAYGHDSKKVSKMVVEGGCNYLAVATLEEALEIREVIKDTPILCLGPVDPEKLDICKDERIAVTVNSLEYAKEINESGLKVHIKINTGMNRLGISSKKDLINVYNELKNKNILIEGVYTHIYNDSSKEDTIKQIELFKFIIEDIKFPIIHIGASGYALNYPKEDFTNGIRIGIAMYGLINNNLGLKSTISLISNVIQINDVKDATVGYNGAYKVKRKERIAVVPIGYADGIIRKNSGRCVYINDKPYRIVGNICMDMLFVKVDDSIKVGDKVYIIKDNKHIFEIADYLETIPYEVICSIGKRIPRIY